MTIIKCGCPFLGVCGSSRLRLRDEFLAQVGLKHGFHKIIHKEHVQDAEAAFVEFCKKKKQAEGGSFVSLASLDHDRWLTWAAEFCRQNGYGGFIYAGGDFQFYDLDYDVLKAEAKRDRSRYHAADDPSLETSCTLFLLKPAPRHVLLEVGDDGDLQTARDDDSIAARPPAPAPAPGAPPDDDEGGDDEDGEVPPNVSAKDYKEAEDKLDSARAAAAASCALNALNAAAVSQAEAELATLKRKRDATLAREIAEETERSRRRINDLQAERDALGILG